MIKTNTIVINRNNNHLEHCLQSIINQAGDFVNNIILCNMSNGDFDNSIVSRFSKYIDIKTLNLQNDLKDGQIVKEALEYCDGDYIAFCNSSDHWFPDKLYDLINNFNKKPSADLIFNASASYSDSEHCLLQVNNKQIAREDINIYELSFHPEENSLNSLTPGLFKGSSLKNLPEYLFDFSGSALPFLIELYLLENSCEVYCLRKVYDLIRPSQVKYTQEEKLALYNFINDSVLSPTSPFHAIINNKIRALAKAEDISDTPTTETSKAQKLAIENKFSIIMPTHNRKYVIAHSVDSILAQEYQNFELIIVGHNCTDNTEEFIKDRYEDEIKKGKIKYYSLDDPDKHGPAFVRNYGLSKANNPWITYFDDDDVVLPNFLYSLNSCINQNPNAKCFYSDILWKVVKHFETPTEFDWEVLLKSNFVGTAGFCHSLNLYKKLGGFDESLNKLEDWELVLRYTKDNITIHNDTITYFYDDDILHSKITNSNITDWSEVESKIHLKYGYNDDNLPTIYTVLVCYNQEDYVRQAIESVLDQVGPFNKKLIVSDDFSTDNTREIIKEYPKQFTDFIIDISPKEHLGINENYKNIFTYLETLDDNCYVAFLEGDDYFLPGKFSKSLEAFKQDKNINFVCSSHVLYDQNKQGVVGMKQIFKTDSCITSADIKADPICNVIQNFSSCIFNKDCLINLPDSLFTYYFGEGPLGCYLLSDNSKAYYLSMPYTVRRLHKNGLQSSLNESDLDLWQYKMILESMPFLTLDNRVFIYEGVLKYIAANLNNRNLLSNSELEKLKNKCLDESDAEYISYKPRITVYTTRNFTFESTKIKDVYIIKPKMFGDSRGYFMETYNKSQFDEAGLKYDFIQDNQSKSSKGVLRGLHFQKTEQQAKLVRCIEGQVFDVAVDLRKDSPTYGKYESVILSAEEGNQFMIPRGFAHGFLVLSDSATFVYKCDNTYKQDDEGGLMWNDETINIKWPEIDCDILLSQKDKNHTALRENKVEL